MPPPPIPAHIKRFTANPTRPARYRPGKAVQEEESDEEEDEEEDEQSQIKQPQRKPQPRPTPLTKRTVVNEDEDEEDEGFVTEDEDEDEDGAGGGALVSTVLPHLPTTSIPVLQRPKENLGEQDDEQSEESSGDDEEEEESEEDSSSEDDAPQRKFQRPTFIKKNDRKPVTEQDQKANAPNEQQPRASAVPEPSSSHHTDDVAARRLVEAEALIKATIERDTAARLAGKKSWDDDDDLPPEALVDDTDGLDPEAEHAAWRLRELHRLKRDREAMVAREKELEEVERRRNLSKEDRDAEDRDFIARQKEEREEGRSQAAYLTKYQHKGAFFMDDEDSARLAKRDLMGAKYADDVDKSVLPEYMKIRDMTKLGKKGRTRYTDLKGQDTGRFGDDVKRWRGSGYANDRDGGSGQDTRGMDERFLPDRYADRGGGPQVSGANASVLRPRDEGRPRRSNSRSHSQEGRDRRNDYRDRNSYQPRSRSREKRRRKSYSRSRSRSRSPPHRSRRRSPSPFQDRDKRRRVET